MKKDTTIPKNKPEITLHDNEKGTGLLIEIAIFGDKNMINK
jgi:hypothetical protein